MNQYPKCIHCGHSKSQHNFVRCMQCFFNFEYEILLDSQLYGEAIIDPKKENKMIHSYHPDNLGFIEKLAERRGLV